MLAIDVHIHTRGQEDGNKILKAMDQVGLKRVVLLRCRRIARAERVRTRRCWIGLPRWWRRTRSG